MPAPDESRQSAAAPAGRMSPAGRALRGAAGFLILFAVMEMVTRAEFISPQYLPRFSTSLMTSLELLTDREFLEALLDTLRVAALGLLATVLVAVPVGLLLGISDKAYEASRILIDFIRPIPSVALVPVAILAMGSGDKMKIALIMFSACWPVIFNTIYGVHATDKIARETARSFGMGNLRIIWSVAFPSALPLAYTGIRLGATIALLMAIGLEILVGGGGGVGGWLVKVGEAYGSAHYLYGGLVVLGLLGWAINWLLAQGGRVLFGWHVSVRSAA